MRSIPEDGDPRLDVEAPRRTWGGRVRVRGTTDLNVANVTVDGRPYPVANGSFDVEVDLGWGSNGLEVEAMDPAGNVAREAVVVRRGVTGEEAVAIVLAAVVALAVVAIRGRRRGASAGSGRA